MNNINMLLILKNKIRYFIIFILSLSILYLSYNFTNNLKNVLFFQIMIVTNIFLVFITNDFPVFSMFLFYSKRSFLKKLNIYIILQGGILSIISIIYYFIVVSSINIFKLLLLFLLMMNISNFIIRNKIVNWKNRVDKLQTLKNISIISFIIFISLIVIEINYIPLFLAYLVLLVVTFIIFYHSNKEFIKRSNLL